jgi:hypothetical protein
MVDNNIFPIFSLLVPAVVAGLEPSTWRCRGGRSTSVLLPLSNMKVKNKNLKIKVLFIFFSFKVMQCFSNNSTTAPRPKFNFEIEIAARNRTAFVASVNGLPARQFEIQLNFVGPIVCSKNLHKTIFLSFISKRRER